MPEIRQIEINEVIKFCERDLRKPFLESAVNECPRCDQTLSDFISDDPKFSKNTTRDVVIPEILNQWIFLGGFPDVAGKVDNIDQLPERNGYGFICSHLIGVRLNADFYDKPDILANHRTIYTYYLRFLKTSRANLLNKVITTLAKNGNQLDPVLKDMGRLKAKSYKNSLNFNLENHLQELEKIAEFLSQSYSFNANSDAQGLLQSHRETIENLKLKIKEFNSLGSVISQELDKFDKQKMGFFKFDGESFGGIEQDLSCYDVILSNSFVKKRLKQIQNDEHIFGP